MILGFKKTMVILGKTIKTEFESKIKNGVKIHTIREDPKSRWKAGNVIHFANGARTKYYNNFCVGRCTSIQKIEIEYFEHRMSIRIDGRELDEEEFEKLSINDGFYDVDDFIEWFKPYCIEAPFIGKLIHWTDLKY